MDYEKKYKEALERAKRLYKDAVTLQLEQDIKDYETIFPELKESEDERIRKWLEETIEAMPENSIDFRDVRRIDVLHWLEKQKPVKWSEEDEENFQHCLMAIKHSELHTADDIVEMYKWLQSLKQRMEENNE